MTSYDTWDSYFWPDAPGVLKNKFGIKNYPDLAVAEAHAVAPRMRGIILDSPSTLPETVDLDYYRQVHHRLSPGAKTSDNSARESRAAA